MDTISSRQNPLIKQIKRLGSNKRDRREQGLAVLEGAHLLESLLDAGKHPTQVIVSEASREHSETQALLTRLSHTSPTYVTEHVFSDLSELKSPTGLLCLTPIPAPEVNIGQACLLLDDIQDPGNIGSILRSSAASGVHEVFLSRGCADAWSPKVLRAGMGAHFHLNIFCDSELDEVARLHEGPVLTTSLDASEPIFDCDLSGPVALIFGNEGAGVCPALQQRAQRRMYIPMPGQAESLNVAAAAAVCLFERVRQERLIQA